MRPDTDVIWLTTGDRVSGEIVQLEGSRLTVNTPFAGRTKIDWSMVGRIGSGQTFLVELGSGLKLEGTLERADDEVRIAAGDSEQLIRPAELKRVGQPDTERTF